MRTALPSLLLLALIAGCSESGTGAPDRLFYIEDGLMRTAAGEVLLLRGINVSGAAKDTPDHLYDLQTADIDLLLESGMNSVRLLTFWKAITPDPGEVDAIYLDQYVDRVRRLTDAGIYVVIDMHQDLWGVPFVNHGAPDWACPDPIKAGYTPQSPWWMNYTSPQVRGCFDNFWGDGALQDRFGDAWVALAARVCENEQVVGFDLMNEPYPGTALFESGFDNEVLLPFYLRVVERIEAVCPGRLYFLEPGGGFVLGFTDPLDFPEELRDRIVWAGHFYPQEVHEPNGSGYDGDRGFLEERLLGTIGYQLDRGVAVWVGEYGGITGNANYGLYVEDLHALLAGFNASSAYWDYTLNDGGFAFLDDARARKPLFDPVFTAPTPTLLPSAPVQTADWANRRMTYAFDCHRDRRARVLLPGADCRCTVEPPDALPGLPAGPGFAEATCTRNEPVTLDCRCD